MDKMLQVQNPHTQQFESVYVCGLPDYPKTQPAPVINVPARSSNSHPLLIGGIVIGLFLGLIACLPAPMRAVVVLGLIASIIWFGWSVSHDEGSAQAYAGTQQPVPVFVPPQEDIDPRPYVVPSPTVRRAQLVRLPRK